MKKIAVYVVLCAAFLGLSGCAKNISANEYNASSANTVQRVEPGVILSKRIVTVNDSSGVGTIAGAIAGGVLGSTIGGSGAASAIGATAGAVGGGYLGGAAESAMNRQNGYEYIVKMKNGNTISLVQGIDTDLAVGSKVLVIYGDKSRIIPDTDYNSAPVTASTTTAVVNTKSTVTTTTSTK